MSENLEKLIKRMEGLSQFKDLSYKEKRALIDQAIDTMSASADDFLQQAMLNVQKQDAINNLKAKQHGRLTPMQLTEIQSEFAQKGLRTETPQYLTQTKEHEGLKFEQAKIEAQKVEREKREAERAERFAEAEAQRQEMKGRKGYLG